MTKGFLALNLAVLVALAAGCEKKPAKNGDTGAINAMDRAGSNDGPVDTAPLDGIDISKLNKDKQATFYKLVGSLSSPCGTGKSLRTSYASEPSCKRAPFAVRYVAALLEDEATEAQVKEEYEHKYESDAKPVKIDVSKAPRVGNDDAPIRLVEFFDYQCPHCQAFKPMLEQVMADRPGKVVVHYMMFPLEKHTNSKLAAQAALAAAQMGKFHEMHDVLFAKSPNHSKDDITGYAKEIGLDPAQFSSLLDAQGAHVVTDVAQGDAAGVDSTPTLYFNERKYEGPIHPKYIEMWIDEELAVNR
ncbi:MAG TPA: thioredoxin domain-containing protein [Kofleriaceae bacterium]|nr:thioredoxin domain-containing protein [Kofleriaceae bacterium]